MRIISYCSRFNTHRDTRKLESAVFDQPILSFTAWSPTMRQERQKKEAPLNSPRPVIRRQPRTAKDAKTSATTGVFLIADEPLGILLAAPSSMAFGAIELPEAIPPCLDRPHVMPECPSAPAAPICFARRSPERPLQPPNQQKGNHHDRPHRQIDQSVIAVAHRLFPLLPTIRQCNEVI